MTPAFSRASTWPTRGPGYPRRSMPRLKSTRRAAGCSSPGRTPSPCGGSRFPASPLPQRLGRGSVGSGSVQLGHTLALEPLGRDLDLDTGHTHCAPDSFAVLAEDVLMVALEVELHGEGAALEAGDRALHQALISSSNSGK